MGIGSYDGSQIGAFRTGIEGWGDGWGWAGDTFFLGLPEGI